MSLNPKTTQQPDGRILMTWSPDLNGLGYRFYRDGVAVSIGTKPGQASTRFKAETDGRAHTYGLRVLGETGPLESSTFPPAAQPGEFGAELPDRIAEPTGPEDVATSASELDDALATSTRRIIRVKGFIDYGSAVMAENTANGPRLTARGTATTTHILYGVPSEGDRIRGRIMFLGDYWRIRGLDVTGYNCIKAADVSDPAKTFRFLDIDRCRLHGSLSSALLNGWGTSSDIQVWDTVFDLRGIANPSSTGLGPYCAYTGGPTSRWTFANDLFLNGNGWSLHLYPQPSDVLYTACTMVGGIKRGGVLLGGQARNAIGVGCIITGSPTAAFEINTGATGAVYDTVGWQNKNGWWQPGYGTLPNDNLLVADPMLDGQWRPKVGSPAKGHVKPERWGVLPALDMDGRARVTADAGCYAA